MRLAVSNQAKQILRERILTLLRNQKEEERLTQSLKIQDKLFNLPEFQASKTILFYASFDGEVHTFPMMQQALQLGKKIAIPKIIQDEKNEKKIIPLLVENLEEDLEAGPFGIQQPKENEKNFLDLKLIDMAIVPGIAFDKNNNRLGRGGGYYDRFLKKVSGRMPSAGLAFGFQVVESLPHHEGQDIPVTYVISN